MPTSLLSAFLDLRSAIAVFFYLQQCVETIDQPLPRDKPHFHVNAKHDDFLQLKSRRLLSPRRYRLVPLILQLFFVHVYENPPHLPFQISMKQTRQCVFQFPYHYQKNHDLKLWLTAFPPLTSLPPLVLLEIYFLLPRAAHS